MRRALYARDEDGEVDLRVTRQPFPSTSVVLDRIRRQSIEGIDYATLERLQVDPAVDPYELYEVTRDHLGEDFALPPAELEIERLAYRAQARRFPAAQVVDVSADDGGGQAGR